MKSDQIDYIDQQDAQFSGGNENRTLDIKSMKYQSENIAYIDFQNPYYHVFLKTDRDRQINPYFSKTDLDGGYFIERENSDNKHTEADYIFVHFSFAPSVIYAAEEVFVTGGFCDWKLQNWNRMQFNAAKACFETFLLLKQGLYDYCYARKDPQTGESDSDVFEGSHYETVNQYAVAVYFHDYHNRYDRLLGYFPLKFGKTM
jgi:hypothetical protein